MEQAEETAAVTDRIVANYLSKRGFREAEELVRREAGLAGERIQNFDDESIANFVLFYNEDELNNPKAYETSYARLVKWVDESIDIYKYELRRILYPVFVHAYLDLVSKGLRDNAAHFFQEYKSEHIEEHSQEIERLFGVTDKIHMQENELVNNFRTNKFIVKMCKYSFELLLCFLQDNKFMLLLRLMNQFIKIEATADKPGQLTEEALAGSGLIGTDSSVKAFNDQEVKLGKLPADIKFYGDVSRAIETQMHSDTKDLMYQIAKILENPTEFDSPNVEDVPLPPKKMVDIATEIEHLRDLRHRVDLSDKNLPSVCCYTFHNALDTLNCLKASNNAQYIAGGFSDSFVKLWKVQSTKPDVQAAPPTNLIGHSGSIYGVDFSSDSNYLISGSEDKTVRLWSVEAKNSLVSYKGHNYPIFDVAFAAQGFYFASASADRTARLWSVDHIFPLRLFVGHLSDVDTVKFHPNCNYVVTGSRDRTCRMWDIHQGTCVRIFTGHGGGITAVAISPDGRTIASAAEDNLIRLWDIDSGNCIKTFVGHESTINSLDFSRNGGLLASGGDDDTVRLWNARDSSTDPESLEKSAGGKHDNSVKNLATKRTPIYSVSYTSRNVLVALGVYCPLKQSTI